MQLNIELKRSDIEASFFFCSSPIDVRHTPMEENGKKILDFRTRSFMEMKIQSSRHGTVIYEKGNSFKETFPSSSAIMVFCVSAHSNEN